MAINMGITRLATVSNYQCYPGIPSTCDEEEPSFYNGKQQHFEDDDFMHFDECDYYVADGHETQSTSGDESSEAYSNNEDQYDEDMEYEVDVEEQSEYTEVKYYDRDEEIEIAASTEMLRIRFPFQSISIRLSDFCCLQEKDLLNDTIVDFYLNHIVEHVLPDEPNRRVTVLPSIFWHNLSISRCAAPCEDDAFKKMSERQKLDSRFGDLFEFVEDFELDVDYVIVPVNEWEHWSLVIVCHPFTERARLLCFDSQLNHDLNDIETIANLIDGFLKYAWLRRTNTESTCELRCVVPRNLPQQTNNFDCGLFICEYTRRFLLAPPENLDSFDFGREYKDFSLVEKRKEMQRAVLSLCPNKQMWMPIVQLLN